MAHAHKLDCESAENECRFIIQSENETEVVELAREHMQDVHGKEFSEDELRSDYLEAV